MQGTFDTDVLVVGAGPGGSSAAYHLARHGIDVTVLEKAAFPREKVCGDGLTPRSVKAIQDMGVDTDDARFERVIGLRVHTRATTIQLPWPDLTSFPPFGLVMPRDIFDQLLAQRAVKAGAQLLERTEALGPITTDGYVTGATVRPSGERDTEPRAIRARYVIAADGAASRFATPTGVRRLPNRPLGIAARRYYRSDRPSSPWIESWLDLWDEDLLLPGYGWSFPMTDGRVNLGAGLLNTFANFQDVSAQRLFDAFARMLPAEREINEETADGEVRSGPLPMGLNRAPLAVPGLVLVGDAAGAVNPFNGEGIAYAIETGRLAADLVSEALVDDRPALTMQYPRLLDDVYGGYFAIGRKFATMIGKPAIMGRATSLLLPRRRIMAFALRAMANLSDGPGGDLQDRLLDLAVRVAKAA